MKDAVNTLQQIDLGRLRESKNNPRGHFDKPGLEELTESVRTHGVLQAILVRPIGTDGEFEIVAGARRFRASKAAKLVTIPAQVRQMSDDQALEIQLIENLQRQDIHPLDEANGYKRLVKMGKTVEELADQVSKSASYIYQRLKLAELIPDGQTAFREARISAAHAVLIAREQEAQQVKLLDWCLGVGFIIAHKPDAQVKQGRKENQARRSVRELAEFIQREIHLDLNKAPFPVSDALLVEKAGACTTCPKNTGFNKKLFADVDEGDRCTDSACYSEKVAVLVQLKVKELRPAAGPTPDLLADGYERATIGNTTTVTPEHYAVIEKKSQACPFTRDAIIATGPKAGQVVSACTDRICKTHFDKDGRRRYADQEGRARMDQDTRKPDGYLKLARRVRAAILNRVLIAAPKKLGREELNLAALALLEGLPGNVRAMLNHRHEWKDDFVIGHDFQRIRKLSDPDLARFVVELVALPDSYVAPYESHGKTVKLPFRLELLAKRARVNVASIEREERKPKRFSKLSPKTRGRIAKANRKAIREKREKKLHTDAKSTLKARTRTLNKAIRKAAPVKGGSRGKAKSKAKAKK